MVDLGLQGFLAGLKELVKRFELGPSGVTSPATAWVAQGKGRGHGIGESCHRGCAHASQGRGNAHGGCNGSGRSGGVSQDSGGDTAVKAAKKQDLVRLADTAKLRFMCFEGPLGAHLKLEVREKIWKGEYVEIFALLPMEKLNLDGVKPERRRKRRYRLIPRNFQNWLQAFAIMASVIGEKNPEHCSVLFYYLDAVGEEHRVYGGTVWWRYDEQLRQRKAIRPSL